MNCSKSTLSGGALPDELRHYDRLFDIRVTQLRRAEGAVRVLMGQITQLVDKFDRLGIPVVREHPRSANLLGRLASARARVQAAHAAIDAVMNRQNELRGRLRAYYESLIDENSDPSGNLPNQQLDSDRETVLEPFDDNRNRGNPDVAEVNQLDGLGAPYRLFR
jgi:hypothetical protein